MPAPVVQTLIPKSRTFTLIRGSAGLVAERELGMRVDETAAFHFDFLKDLPVNGHLSDLVSVSIKTGTVGGVTFANLGIDGARGTVDLTAVTAGSYVLLVKASLDCDFGGATLIAEGSLVVS